MIRNFLIFAIWSSSIYATTAHDVRMESQIILLFIVIGLIIFFKFIWNERVVEIIMTIIMLAIIIGIFIFQIYSDVDDQYSDPYRRPR